MTNTINIHMASPRTKTKRGPSKFSQEIKDSVLDEYFNEGATASSLTIKYGLGKYTAKNWIYAYRLNHANIPHKSHKKGIEHSKVKPINDFPELTHIKTSLEEKRIKLTTQLNNLIDEISIIEDKLEKLNKIMK